MPKEFVEEVKSKGFIPLQKWIKLYRKYTILNVEVINHTGEIKTKPIEQSKAV